MNNFMIEFENESEHEAERPECDICNSGYGLTILEYCPSCDYNGLIDDFIGEELGLKYE